jgi:hypothetical protein
MRAFTLLETLIYLGLFSLLVSGTFSAVYAIAESSALLSTDTVLHEEGAWLSYEIKNSQVTGMPRATLTDLTSNDTSISNLISSSSGTLLTLHATTSTGRSRSEDFYIPL